MDKQRKEEFKRHEMSKELKRREALKVNIFKLKF